MFLYSTEITYGKVRPSFGNCLRRSPFKNRSL